MRRQAQDVNRNLVLASMCIALATVVSAVSSLNVALPDLARDLHATQTQLQWIVDAYAVVFAGLLLLAGAIGDAFGRRHILLAGLALFSAAAACALLVDDPSALIAVRAVMGLGAAAIMPATLSIITNVFPADERDRAVSIWAGVAGGSALLGLLVSGVLLEAFSWDSIFAFSAVLGLAALAFAARMAPNSTAAGIRLDVTGGLISAVEPGHARVRDHRRARAGLDRRRHSGCVRHRGGVACRLRGLGAAARAAAARSTTLQAARLRSRNGIDPGPVLRLLRLHLRDTPVRPVRPGVLGLSSPGSRWRLWPWR